MWIGGDSRRAKKLRAHMLQQDFGLDDLEITKLFLQLDTDGDGQVRGSCIGMPRHGTMQSLMFTNIVLPIILAPSAGMGQWVCSLLCIIGSFQGISSGVHETRQRSWRCVQPRDAMSEL